MKEGDIIYAFDGHKWMHTPTGKIPTTNFMMPATILQIRIHPTNYKLLADIQFEDGRIDLGRWADKFKTKA